MVRQAGAVEPVRVGINDASTFTGFCAGHDSSTFRPVEVEEFTATQTQIGLFAYRPLCMEIFTKMGARQNASYVRTLDRGKPLSEQRRIQSMVDTHESGLALGMRDLAHHKREFDGVLRQGDVKGIAGYVVEFSDPPELLASGIVIPECDFHGQPLQDLMSSVVLDYVSFNLIPTEWGGAAIFSWLGEQPACDRLCASLDRLSDGEIPSAVVRFAFEFFENTCMSPAWWLGLSGDARASIRNRHLSGLQNIRPASCLQPDGVALVNWGVVSRKHVGGV